MTESASKPELGLMGPGTTGPGTLTDEQLITVRRRVAEMVRTVRMNAVYHELLEARYTTRDKLVRGASAIAGLSAVGSMAILQTESGSAVWQTLTALTTVLATLSAVWDVPKNAQLHNALRKQWTLLKARVDRFDDALNLGGVAGVGDVLKLLEAINEQKSEIEHQEPPSDQKLLEAAQAAVRRALPMPSFETRSAATTPGKDPPDPWHGKKGE